MRLNYRRSIMGGRAALPAGYRYIEYIYNPSKAYIDTGFCAEGGWKVEVVAKLMKKNAINFIVGSHNPSYNPSNGYNRNQILNDDENTYWSFNKCSSFSNHTHVIDLEKHTFIMDSVGTRHMAEIDGVVYFDNQTSEVLHPVNNIVIGIFQYDGTYIPDTNIYSLKIWDKDYHLVRDMLPCVNAHGVAGLWDFVESKFYHSMTDTEFMGGAGCRIIALRALTAERRAA